VLFGVALSSGSDSAVQILSMALGILIHATPSLLALIKCRSNLKQVLFRYDALGRTFHTAHSHDTRSAIS
jgi:hypothetical protein